MPVSIVVGGQFGSEGKGKVAKIISEMENATAAIRCGGTNSGHTVIDKNKKPIIFQQLPTACMIPKILNVLCAGMYIDLEILFNEISISNIDKNHLFIDPNALIINNEMVKKERNSKLRDAIGSTGSGTGEAVIQRIKRNSDTVFAKDILELKPYIRNVKKILREMLNQNKRIVLEGTQGYGLSLLHSPYYPNVTSRDTIASSFLSETGLSPFDVDDIVLVLRSFPIRVSGNSGPLPDEVEWKTITKESGATYYITEKTSVTKQIRRVARFNPDIVCKAIQVNKPSRIVLNHLDYIDFQSKKHGMTDKILQFVKKVSVEIGQNIDFIGTGPDILIKNNINFL